ncbi:cysteine desulfurase [Sporosarcina aquimarina]|uniref:cysteine desulfurase family protein n=1 Tax=Sporosarcina aquimarina TaxID=114975 RepID=UPI00203CEB84|nr:cysteine desulfurase family protein [Sporosarcina aquimarina]MCM3757487.1 cysteine desulfurase [Sporosarcina aquimarina]
MIYLDNSATTIPEEEVLQTFTQVNRTYYANPASLHQAGNKSEQLLESARKQIATLAGDSESTVIFTSGGTEANNLAVVGYANSLKHRGNHIITTEIEHDSVRNACLHLQKEGFEIDFLSVNDAGQVSPEELKQKIRKDTILVSIMHVNNEIGSIQPIEACSKVIRDHSRATFHSDCVQSLGKLPLPYPEWVDAVTFSAHKIHGLKGTGCLVTKKFKEPEAVTFGGGQEHGFRSGTANVAGAVAFAKAVRIVNEKNNLPTYKRWSERLRNLLNAEKLVRVCSPIEGAPHIFTVAFKGITGEVAVNYFQAQGIMVSTSSACSSKTNKISHVIQAIHVPDGYRKGVIRISFGNMNTEEEIDTLLQVIKEFLKMIKKGMKQHDLE